MKKAGYEIELLSIIAVANDDIRTTHNSAINREMRDGQTDAHR